MTRRKAFLTAILLLATSLAIGFGGIVTAAADDEWSWANYGFSGSAIANPDPFETTSYLIGGYVASVNHLHPLPSSYVYNSDIILDTEGVAMRFRFSWANTEPGYRAVADLADGIAVYPMDESLDVAIVTDDGVQRFSFPVPAAYDCMKANHYTISDDGSHMVISVCGKTVTVLKLDGTRNVDNKAYYTSITVTDGNGYVYGRLTNPLVLRNGGFAGYSSQTDRALILVKTHSLAAADIDFEDFAEEKETFDGWVPETEAATAPETMPETTPETGTDTLPASTDETEPVTAPETMLEDLTETDAASDSVSEAPADTSETEAEADAGGCGAVLETGVLLLSAAAALVLGKKKE